MGRTKVILDTDTGVDDAMAIIMALRSPDLEVLAVTTVSGNVHVDQCTRNVRRVLSLLAPEPPLCQVCKSKGVFYVGCRIIRLVGFPAAPGSHLERFFHAEENATASGGWPGYVGRRALRRGGAPWRALKQ